MVQEEFIITSKEIRFEVVAVLIFFSVKSSQLDPTDHKGILLILVSLGFVLIIYNSNETEICFVQKILNGTCSFRCALTPGVNSQHYVPLLGFHWTIEDHVVELDWDMCVQV